MSRIVEAGRRRRTGGSAIEGVRAPRGAFSVYRRFGVAAGRSRGAAQVARGRRDVRQADAGQAVAEFAIVLVPLMLLLLAILQFALIYNAQVGLTNAIRDTARYASGVPVTTTAAAGTASASSYSRLTAAIAANVNPYSSSRLTSPTGVCYRAHVDGAGATAAFVTVTAAYDHELVVPLIGGILDAIDGSSNNSFRLSVSTEIRVDNPTQATIAIPSPVCAP